MALRFPFSDMAARVRKDPLGPFTMRTLAGNISAVDVLAGTEHAVDGSHNALEVPRTVGTVLYSAGYSLGSFNSRLSSVSSGATGTVTCTLAAAQFYSPEMVPLIAPVADSDFRPIVACYEVVSATSVKVYLQKLTVSLGTGNTWAAANASFGLALHTLPGLAASPLTPSRQWYRTDPLTDGTDDWSGLVRSAGTLRALQTAEHSAGGSHSVREVARHVGFFSWGGASYTQTEGTFSSVSRVSAGVVDVTCGRTFVSANAMTGFPEAHPASNVELWVANPAPQSTTVCRVHLFKYDSTAHTWGYADGDFSLAVFGVLA